MKSKLQELSTADGYFQTCVAEKERANSYLMLRFLNQNKDVVSQNEIFHGELLLAH